MHLNVADDVGIEANIQRLEQLLDKESSSGAPEWTKISDSEREQLRKPPSKKEIQVATENIETKMERAGETAVRAGGGRTCGNGWADRAWQRAGRDVENVFRFFTLLEIRSSGDGAGKICKSDAHE